MRLCAAGLRDHGSARICAGDMEFQPPENYKRLTTSQYRFVKEIAQHHDATRAYRTAYNPKNMADETISTEASKLSKLPHIAARIEQEIAEIEAITAFTPASALMAFLDVAMADPRELIELKVGCCHYCHGADGRYQWDMPSYLEEMERIERIPEKMRVGVMLPDTTGGFGYDPRSDPNDKCVKCAGNGVQRVVPKDTSKLSRQGLLLYGGVKQTRNGIEIIIADRQKALENAARIIGAFKDNVRLDGTIPAMLDVIRETDPVVASQKYQELMRRTSGNGKGAQPTAH